jgi:hypothetical protein
MSDDFLAEIDAAVKSSMQGGNTLNTTNIPKPAEHAVAPEPASSMDIQNRLYDDLGMPKDEVTKEPAKEENQEQNEDDTTKTDEKDTKPKSKDEELEEKATKKEDTITEDKDEKEPKSKSTSSLDIYLKEDAKGNLVDDNGAIMFPAGKSRALFEKVRKEGRQIREQGVNLAISQRKLVEYAKQTTQELEDYKANPVRDAAKHHGIPPQAYDQAIELAKSYAVDPINAIKTLLTRAHASGIDLSKIGTKVEADPEVLRKIQTEAMQAVLDKQNQKDVEPTQEQRLAEARTIAVNFFSQNLDALHYQKELQAVLQKYPNATLEQAWEAIQKHLAKADDSDRYKVITESKDQERDKPKQPARRTRKPAPAEVDYSTMSFDQIAETLKKEIG